MKKATTKEFVKRLTEMLDKVTKSKKKIGYFCPGHKMYQYTHNDSGFGYAKPVDNLDRGDWCSVCRHFMRLDFRDACPCSKYGKNAAREARKRIEEYGKQT